MHHGGGDLDNCKPNYLSVMSYSEQFSNYLSNRPLDYSQSQLSNLAENGGLDENAGVSASTPAGLSTVYGPAPALTSPTGTAINWNRAGGSTDTGVSANVHNLGIPGCSDTTLHTLSGYNDWINLGYNFRTASTFATGISTDPAAQKEITIDTVRQISTSQISSLDTAIQNLPNTAFAGNAISDKASYHTQLLTIDGYIQQDNLVIAASALQQIRSTMDSSVGGLSSDDVITSASAQSKILPLVDNIISSFNKESQPAPGTLHPTPGHVTGQGVEVKGTHFEFNVQSNDGNTFKGNLHYDDKSSKIDLDSSSITYLSVDPSNSKATISGTTKLNNKSGYTFSVYVEDNGKGKTDFISIKILDSSGSTVYAKQGLLQHGNIVIHKTGN